MEFHETVLGKRYFEAQLPGLITALERLGNILENRQKTCSISMEACSLLASDTDGDFLDQLYCGTLQTGITVKSNVPEKVREQLIFASKKLEKTLSEEQWPLYLQYNEAVNRRNSEENRCLFRQGYCLAVQLIMVGMEKNKKINDKEKK